MNPGDPSCRCCGAPADGARYCSTCTAAMQTDSIQVGRQILDRTICTVHKRIDPESIRQRQAEPKVHHLNFQLKKTTASSRIRVLTMATNQITYDRIMERVREGGLEHPDRYLRRLVERDLGLSEGEADQGYRKPPG